MKAVNFKRIAHLLRQIADELDPALPANDAAPLAKADKHLITDIDRAKARRALRRFGVDV